MSHKNRIPSIAAGIVLGLVAPSAWAQAEAIGVVVGVRGEARAVEAGHEARSLYCGDLIRPGDVVSTASASRVSVLIGDVYAQLFVHSRAAFGASASGAPDLSLERGRMRIVDPRTRGDAPTIHVKTPMAEARFAGNDVDMYVLGPPGQTNAMICSERTLLRVDRLHGTVESAATPAGECAIASLGKAIYRARIPSERIGLAEAPGCDRRRDVVGARFTGTDVAGRPASAPLLPTAAGAAPREPCDVPGALCAVASQPKDDDESPEDDVGGFPGDRLPGFPPTEGDDDCGDDDHGECDDDHDGDDDHGECNDDHHGDDDHHGQWDDDHPGDGGHGQWDDDHPGDGGHGQWDDDHPGDGGHGQCGGDKHGGGS